eukprot:SAG22_NODE_16768_length_318_cov_0.917808_2_plen_56_part_01
MPSALRRRVAHALRARYMRMRARRSVHDHDRLQRMRMLHGAGCIQLYMFFLLEKYN